MKRRKINQDLKTIYALIQVMKKDSRWIECLQKIRINPKLMVGKHQKVKMRADLEFYLPQLICQFLRSDLSDHEEKELVSFVLKACDLNLFFAHKVWFFLEASKINKDSSHQIKKIFSL